MLKISVAESRSRRRLILDGKLLAPWVTELRTGCETARVDLQHRELIIALKNVIGISEEGEKTHCLSDKRKSQFRCGVFIQHVLRHLAHKTRRNE